MSDRKHCWVGLSLLPWCTWVLAGWSDYIPLTSLFSVSQPNEICQLSCSPELLTQWLTSGWQNQTNTLKHPMFTTKPASTSQIHTLRQQNPRSLKNVTRYGTKWMTVVFLVPGRLSMLSWEIKAIRLGALSDLAVGHWGMWIALEGALTYSYVCDAVSFNPFP